MHRQHHAVVIGASIAGLATARVLADHFETVTVVDRDQLPAGADPRKGVPQGRHAHALLAGGARTIFALFPGLEEELIAGGAGILDFNDGHWFQAGGYRTRNLLDRKVVSASRPFIEHHVRRRTAALANVTIEQGTAVNGLAADGERVRGVRIQTDDGPRTLVADLVVDCSGRASRASHWMQEIGYPAPAVAEVRCDVRYATTIMPRSPGDLDGTYAVTIESPPHGKRAAFLLPLEGDRWIATITSSFGTPVPADAESFRAAAGTLPAPQMGSVVDGAESLGPIATHRLVSSRRLRYEKLRHVPRGFVALGDAICSFNPVYGQGMSSAVMQAGELGAALERHGIGGNLERAFYKRAARVINTPWQIAVGADFAYPECTGPKPPGTDLVNRYMHRVLLAAQVSPEVNTAMILVQNLLAPPTTLMRPSLARKVRRAAREAERRLADIPAPERMSDEVLV